MNFFFDNNLSPNLSKAMSILEEDGDIKHLSEVFARNEKDEVWLQYIGKKGMILITRDKKIRKRPSELMAFRENNVGAFILTGKALGKWREIKQLICAWEEIKALSENTSRPFAYQVPPKGRIHPLSI